MQKLRQYLVVILLGVALLCSCQPRPKDEIVLGTSADYPPFEFMQEGEVVGLDIDVAKKIAQKLNRKLVIKEMDFNSLIPALKADKVDFIMAGFSVSEERKKNVDFTLPYFQSQFTMITLEDKPIHTLNQLANKRIGVQLGSVMESFLKEVQETVPNLSLESLPKNMPLIQNLKLGRLDGVMVEDAQATAFVEANPGLLANQMAGGKGEYAIALQKNSEWLTLFNQAIAALEASGELDLIKDKWVNPNPQSASSEFGWVTYIIKGTWVTLQFTLFSVGIGLFIGILLSLAKLSNKSYLIWPTKIYISIFRGTPLLLQLSFVYFAVPALTGFDISVFVAGITAFGLNSGAYVSEIIRAGIQSVDKGQFEAAKALGVPYRLMMQDIILPQSFKNILPALVNELVNMLKESAIISTIGAADLMKRAQVVSAEQYSYFAPLLVAAACYYVTVIILTTLAQFLERKMRQEA